mmetsp:Transcript_22742/g.73165  ORF Transcript_22742/g.73165 Transcript_22742/m.73165 type:complete len:329 (-) Transcript_22742:743-1729(-)
MHAMKGWEVCVSYVSSHSLVPWTASASTVLNTLDASKATPPNGCQQEHRLSEHEGHAKGRHSDCRPQHESREARHPTQWAVHVIHCSAAVERLLHAVAHPCARRCAGVACGSGSGCDDNPRDGAVDVNGAVGWLEHLVTKGHILRSCRVEDERPTRSQECSIHGKEEHPLGHGGSFAKGKQRHPQQAHSRVLHSTNDHQRCRGTSAEQDSRVQWERARGGDGEVVQHCERLADLGHHPPHAARAVAHLMHNTLCHGDEDDHPQGRGHDDEQERQEAAQQGKHWESLLERGVRLLQARRAGGEHAPARGELPQTALRGAVHAVARKHVA